MTTCGEIGAFIEKLAPVALAEDWDNVGLLVGDAEQEVKMVLLSLDMDEYVAQEAADIGADLVVTHHPVMFEPIQRLTEDDPQQRALRLLIEHHISHYAAHTNLDVAAGGLNDYMAFLLGLKNTEILDVTQETDNVKHGFGRYCELETPVQLKEMMERCKTVFHLSGVKYVGYPDRLVRRVAVNTGGGAGIIGRCYEEDIDLFITGDIKYTVAREAYERGMAVIDAGHYDTEIIVMDFMERYLSNQFPKLELVQSKENIRVLETYISSK